MGLEAVLYCVDNSDWSTNGDYVPSRLGAQAEVVNNQTATKVEENPETAVAVLSMGGARPDVNVSLTRDLRRVMNVLAKEIKSQGTANVPSTLKIAQLALKNRPNKNQRQRIVMFVASPVELDAAELAAIGKQMKKNSVALDVVLIGLENQGNGSAEKLQELVNAVNSGDNSHFVHIPPGEGYLSDILRRMAPFNDGGNRAGAGAFGGGGAVGGGGAGGGGGGGGGGGIDDFDGVDPNMDPELAMVLRMSMEEERARRAAMGGAAAGASDGAAGAGAAAAGAGAAAGPGAMDLDDEDAMMQQALAMSMMQDPSAMMDVEPAAGNAAGSGGDAGPGAAAGGSGAAGADLLDPLRDPAFIESLLRDAGADPSDDQVAEMLSELSRGGASAQGQGQQQQPPQQKKDDGKKDGSDNNKKSDGGGSSSS